MLERNISGSPFDPSAQWSEPNDPDLRFLSACAYAILVNINNLSSDGFKFRQLEGSDVTTINSDIQTTVNSILAELYPPPPDN